MGRRRWSNWAGNQGGECEVVTPRTLPELQEAVKRAAEAGRRVRAAGASYSWSPLVPNREQDTIVRMHRLDRLLGFEKNAHTLEIECGMTIAALDRLATDRKLTLVSPTLFPKPSVGGVIATGSHGTGRAVGGFSDQIREMTIIMSDGSLRTVRRGEHAFPAAQVALGALGIVYSVKLEAVPDYNVYVDKRYVPSNYVLEEFEDLQKSCDFLEILWFPLQPKMWLYLMDLTDSLPDRKRWWTRLRSGLDTRFERLAAGRLIPWVARHAPRLTPRLNSLASGWANEVNASVQTASDAFHFQRAYPKNWDLCYAVPAGAAVHAWRDAIRLVEDYARADRYPVNLALHCRFTGRSDAWLAPNHDRRTCFVEVTTAKSQAWRGPERDRPSSGGGTTARREPEWEAFFRELEGRWLAIEGARPHWGKLYWHSRGLRRRYPKMNDFLDVRQRWDPERVFLNRFLEEDVFQLPAHAPATMQPAPPSYAHPASRSSGELAE